MGEDDLIEGFFVEDEIPYKEEQVRNLINRVKKYAKLAGKSGDVNIEKEDLTDTDKTKLFLIVRYLGAELAKLKPELGINEDIAEVSIDEFAKFIDRDPSNARARMSQLDKEGFASKTVKGKLKVRSLMVKKFIEYLETPKEDTSSKARIKQKKPIKPRISQITKSVLPEIDNDEVYDRLTKNLEVDKGKLKDVLFFVKDGIFKFDGILGQSRSAKQRNCILTTCYVLSIGYGATSCKTQFLTKVCFESGIDTTGLRYLLRDMKDSGYITKGGTGTRDNILKESGKKEATKILKEMCSK